jgi:hypothetical protein
MKVSPPLNEVTMKVSPPLNQMNLGFHHVRAR